MYRSASQVFYWIIHTKSGAALKPDRVVQLQCAGGPVYFTSQNPFCDGELATFMLVSPRVFSDCRHWLPDHGGSHSNRMGCASNSHSSPFVELFVRLVNPCHGRISSCVVFSVACVHLCYTCIRCLYQLHVQMLPSLLASIQHCPDTSSGTIWPNRR